MWYSLVVNTLLIILIVVLMVCLVGSMFLIVYSIEKTYQEGLDIVEGIKEDRRKFEEESKKYWSDWAKRNKKEGKS